MPGPLTTGSLSCRYTPDPLGESHDGLHINPFQPSSSSKACCRPLFNTFQAPRAWISLFRPLILAGLEKYVFCVMEPEAFFSLLCMLEWFFNTPCCPFRVGCLSLLKFLLKNLPCFFFILRNYDSFYWRIHLGFISLKHFLQWSQGTVPYFIINSRPLCFNTF